MLSWLRLKVAAVGGAFDPGDGQAESAVGGRVGGGVDTAGNQALRLARCPTRGGLHGQQGQYRFGRS